MKPPGRHTRATRALASTAVVKAVAQWADHLEAAFDPGRVAEGLLPTLAEASGATRASLMLVNPRTGRLRLVAGLGLPRSARGDLPPSPRRISDWVLRENTSLIVNGEPHDERFEASAPRQGIASAMSIPLPGGRGVVGVLNLARIGTTIPFVTADLAPIEAAGAALGALFERILEVGAAREHWRRADPPASFTESPEGLASNLALSLRSGASLAPDVFVQVRRADGARVMMVAEPFGTPVQARFLAEWMCGAFQAMARRANSMTALAAEMDARLRERRDGDASRAWFGSVSTSGQFVSCAAGYPPPFCLPSEGTAGQRLREGGPPLGAAVAPSDFEETVLRLLPGDGFLVISDGLLHATSHAGRRWEEEMILGHLHDHWPGPIHGLAQGLTEAACRHIGLAVPPDDILALVFRYARSG